MSESIPTPKRRGRPPKPAGTARNGQMMIRLNDAEFALLEAAAGAAGGQAVSAWARDLLLAAAQMILEDEAASA